VKTVREGGGGVGAGWCREHGAGTLGVGACVVRDLRKLASTGCVPRGTGSICDASIVRVLAVSHAGQAVSCVASTTPPTVARATPKCTFSEVWVCSGRVPWGGFSSGVHRTANGSAGYSKFTVNCLKFRFVAVTYRGGIAKRRAPHCLTVAQATPNSVS
jgi:hypothetical protein